MKPKQAPRESSVSLYRPKVLLEDQPDFGEPEFRSMRRALSEAVRVGNREVARRLTAKIFRRLG